MYEFDWLGLYDGSPISASSEDEALEETKAELDKLGQAIEEEWKWQVKEKVERQWKEAERLYEELLSKGGPSEKSVDDMKQSRWKICAIM